MKITDLNNNPINYVPIFLNFGEEKMFNVLVTPKSAEETLFAEDWEGGVIEAEKTNAGALQNIEDFPLNVWEGEDVAVEVTLKFTAGTVAGGVVRKMILIGTKSGLPAQWR